MELKEKLIRFREEQGLSQTELAQELGVTRQAVSGWERGANAPAREKLMALSRLYGVPLDELVGGEPQPGEEPPVPEKAEAPPPVDGEAPRKRGRNIAVRIGLAACLILVTVAAVITIWSAVFKEPEKPEEGRTIINQDDLEPDYINPEEILNLTDETKIIVP